MRRRFGLVAACAFMTCLAASPAAFAVQRFASPTGSGTGDCRSPDPADPTNPPCTLQRAVEDVAQTGDEVIVNPGTYNEIDILNITDAIDLHGASGPRPVIMSSAVLAVQVDGVAASVRSLDIEHSGNGTALRFLNSGASAASGEDLVVHSTSSQAQACSLSQAAGATLRNSVCRTTSDGAAVSAIDFSGATYTANLRNVTAISTGTGTFTRGIVISSGATSNISIDARNVIANGNQGADVAAFADPGGTATVTLAHSNYDTEQESGATATITDPGSPTNQVAPPLLGDPANGDFHQLAGSPTIDAGNPAFASGQDIDGEPRSLDGDCSGLPTPTSGRTNSTRAALRHPSPNPSPSR
jgi:hypothetical protein